VLPPKIINSRMPDHVEIDDPAAGISRDEDLLAGPAVPSNR
jgi:hypothetical protein